MTILELIQSDGFYTKKKASTRGGEYAGPCPWCAGDNRFLCWPEQGEFGEYWCRKCGRGGDAIQYLRDYRRMTYPEACQYLGREVTRPSTLAGSRPVKPQWKPRVTAAPGDLWQKRAWSLVEESENWLFHPSTFGQRMLGWLKERRGLSEETIRAHRLGLVPIDRYEGYERWGFEPVLKDTGTPRKIKIPRGVTIPLCQDDKVLRIRVRRLKSDGDPRYYLIRGSDTRAMVLGQDRDVFVVVESELDAILVFQEAGDLTGAISMGNAQARPDVKAMEALSHSTLILVALDGDDAGAKESWGWWMDHFPQARRWPPVEGKDPGDMQAVGVNIRTWVEAGLTEYKDVAAQPERTIHQAGIEEELAVEEHHEPPPSSHFATCESCHWYALNPWTSDPALGAWCHRQMEHLVVGSPVCEEFRRGEVPHRQNHERASQAQPSTSPAPQEHVLTCFECSLHEHDTINPSQGWGRCTLKKRGCYGLRPACPEIPPQDTDVSLDR